MNEFERVSIHESHKLVFITSPKILFEPKPSIYLFKNSINIKQTDVRIYQRKSFNPFKIHKPTKLQQTSTRIKQTQIQIDRIQSVKVQFKPLNSKNYKKQLKPFPRNFNA